VDAVGGATRRIRAHARRARTARADDSPEDLPRAFSRQSLPRRAFIVAAGPVANFLLAILLYLLLNLVGVQEPAARLTEPPTQSAAAAAGVADGDRIVAVDGRDVRSWNEVRLRLIDAVIERRAVALAVERAGERRALVLDASALPAGEVERDFLRTLAWSSPRARCWSRACCPRVRRCVPGSARRRGARRRRPALGRAAALIDAIRASAGRPMRLDVRRGGDTLRVEIVPDARPSDRPGEEGRLVGRINAGVSGQVEMVEVRYVGLEAVERSLRQTWDMSVFSLRMLGKMLTGELSWRNLSGPVSIADYAGQSARVGWFAYVSFLALISISLGVLNLLPIPCSTGAFGILRPRGAARSSPVGALRRSHTKGRAGRDRCDDGPGPVQRPDPTDRIVMPVSRTKRGIRSRFVARAAAGLAALLLANAASAFDPFVVRDIRIEGAQRTEAGTVFSYLPIKVGELLTEDKAAAAVRALFATGFFKDVKLEVEGDVLVVFLEERPAVASITISGTKEFDQDTIKRALRDIGLAESRIFDRSLLERGEQELKRQYLGRGRYAARVTSTVTPLERNRVAISMAVEEAKPLGSSRSASSAPRRSPRSSCSTSSASPPRPGCPGTPRPTSTRARSSRATWRRCARST